ncbi:YbgC/FadM family acyl-CoA thioesterase [Legionella londiniensis]|uniref:Acyl-CoA thioesterase n=1 Tax=Legionella londiniensis TaxID=45068 RepID=A0A0W0VMW4_9GAMM|nr:YbgC/FadM family acyl-CoA thioesterase [Legionella londiniensis]KTD21158.1 acyl-CoA thioesterase [Legionella londiniensis]STX93180.1 acyl-CoA thioesterase [Legionella londiniensis]
MDSILEDKAEFRVYAENTDYLGIVYYADYLLFLERGRTEMLRKLGLILTEAFNHDTNFAIYDVHIRFHSPAYLDDLLTVKTTCKQARASKLEFKQSILKNDDKLVAEATVEVVCVNKNLKPKRLPEHLLKCLNNG